jgi:hypothetical protein
MMATGQSGPWNCFPHTFGLRRCISLLCRCTRQRSMKKPLSDGGTICGSLGILNFKNKVALVLETISFMRIVIADTRCLSRILVFIHPGSGSRIPDPGSESRIPDPGSDKNKNYKRRGGKICCDTFFVAINFTKNEFFKSF